MFDLGWPANDDDHDHGNIPEMMSDSDSDDDDDTRQRIPALTSKTRKESDLAQQLFLGSRARAKASSASSSSTVSVPQQPRPNAASRKRPNDGEEREGEREEEVPQQQQKRPFAFVRNADLPGSSSKRRRVTIEENETTSKPRPRPPPPEQPEIKSSSFPSVSETLSAIKFKTGRWSQHITDLKQQFDKDYARLEQSKKLVRFSVLAADERLQDASYVDVQNRLAKIRKTFNSLGLVPTEHQRALFDYVTMACLPRIVGPTWESRKVEIMRELNMRDLPVNIHWIMPRQHGKSTVMAMILTSLGYHVPMNAAVFSTASRTSRALNRQTRNFLLRLEGGQKRLVVSNAEVLEVSTIPISSKKDARSEFNSRICAYPASGDSKCPISLCVFRFVFPIRT